MKIWIDSNGEIWDIINVYDAKAVLLPNIGVSLPNDLKSSYIVGYNNITRKMELKLNYYSVISQEYLDVSMVKSSSGELTLYYKNRIFKKKQ